MRTDYQETNQNKLLRIIRRNGLLHLLKKISYRLIYQPLIYLFAKKEFKYNDRTFNYFRHSYNTTFINERCIEIPIFFELLEKYPAKKILEVGNVLSHYRKATWTIVDKFENSKGVTNIDVINYHPPKPFSLIIAISTFEHVGFDEYPKDEKKFDKTISHLIGNCLEPHGELHFSIPVGWNPSIDKRIKDGKYPFRNGVFFERINWLNEWKETKPLPQWFYHKYTMFATKLAIFSVSSKK